jgi:hypothetical protein
MTVPRVSLVARQGERSIAVELDADPARTYTWIPLEVAAFLGLRRLGVCSLENSAGRLVTRALAEVVLEHGGRLWPSTVVLCEPGDAPAVGALTLEAFGLAAAQEARGADRPVELLA